MMIWSYQEIVHLFSPVAVVFPWRLKSARLLVGSKYARQGAARFIDSRSFHGI